ncbi:MAG TPA: hypothetical protein VHE59_10510 [Mucilaginibacter sp.]|nr:hypothetical protein [Mucilaginibacter sp.]
MTEAEILGMSDKQRERLVKRLFAELKRMNKLICGGEIEIYKID